MPGLRPLTLRYSLALLSIQSQQDCHDSDPAFLCLGGGLGHWQQHVARSDLGTG